jgi:NitT/TauT family transport system substrate-binding protein
MRIWLRLGCLAAAVWLILVGLAHAEPLRISYFIWIGNGPFFVAKEKGLFADEGVEVELINIEVHAAAFGSLFNGQVDAVQGAMPDAPTFAQPDEAPLVCVLALDDSRGGDGALATKDIQTIADLKGKSVAFLRGSISQFYLDVLLKEAGLREADIEVVDLSAEDAAQAFSLQEVDAAVTNDPFLTQAKSVGHGHLLTEPGSSRACWSTA